MFRLKPDMVGKGKNMNKGFNPEQSALEGYGGKLLFTSGEASLSPHLISYGGSFKKSIFQPLKNPFDFIQRHNLDMKKTG